MNANESLEKTEWRDKIRASIDVTKVAQRNWDLTRSISDEDLNTLIYAASNSPRKDMVTHYALHVLTHPAKVREFYDHTKKFTLFPKSRLVCPPRLKAVVSNTEPSGLNIEIVPSAPYT